MPCKEFEEPAEHVSTAIGMKAEDNSSFYQRAANQIVVRTNGVQDFHACIESQPDEDGKNHNLHPQDGIGHGPEAPIVADHPRDDGDEITEC